MDEIHRKQTEDAGNVPVKTPKWYKIYPNLSGRWCVDDGVGEILVCHKVITASDKPSYTETYGNQNWFLVRGVLRTAKDEYGRIVVTIMRK